MWLFWRSLAGLLSSELDETDSQATNYQRRRDLLPLDWSILRLWIEEGGRWQETVNALTFKPDHF